MLARVEDAAFVLVMDVLVVVDAAFIHHMNVRQSKRGVRGGFHPPYLHTGHWELVPMSGPSRYDPMPP